MNRSSKKLLILLAFFTFTFGCSFAKARALDFADIFKFKIHWGYGIGATAYCTPFIDIGLEAWAAAFPFSKKKEHRYNVLAFYQRRLRLQVQFVSFHSAIVPGLSYRKILWYEKGVFHSETRTFALWEGGQIIGEGHGGSFSVKEWNKNYDRSMFGVGFCVHAGIIGTSFEISLEELFDFLLGWFGIDIMKDDRPPPTASTAPSDPLHLLEPKKKTAQEPAGVP